MSEPITFTYENDDGEEVEESLPTSFRVCPTCRGNGKHVNRNIDGNGITGSEWAELCAEDEDFADNYMSGMYDVTCEECNGIRVIPEIDVESLSEDQKKLYEIYCEQQESARQDRIDSDWERRYCV